MVVPSKNVWLSVTNCTFEPGHNLDLNWVGDLRKDRRIEVSVTGYTIRGTPLPSPAAIRAVREAEPIVREPPLVKLGICAACGSLVPEPPRPWDGFSVFCPVEDAAWCAAVGVHDS